MREHAPKKQGKHSTSGSRSRGGPFKNPVRAASSWKVCGVASIIVLFSGSMVEGANFARVMLKFYPNDEQSRSKRSAPAGYRYFTEFRSHEGEFDYLKSLEIEEKINQIKWCRRSTDALMMLTTNGKCLIF